MTSKGLNVDKNKYRHSISQERIEHVSDLIGSWGPLQKRLFLLLSIIYCVSPYTNASLFYYSLKSDLVCVQPDGSKSSISSDKCSFDQLNSCSSWYHNITRKTVTKEWNLVCERYWLRSLVLSSYQFGYLLSGLVIGYISDRFGRKPAILFSMSLEIVCAVGLVLSPNVYCFIVVRVIHGIGGYGRYLASLILLLESIGPKYRGRIAVTFDWVWCFGEYIMMIITYNVLNFRYIYMGTIVFQIACIPIILMVPESARWQLVVGQVENAERTLRVYAAKRRKQSVKTKLKEIRVDDEDAEDDGQEELFRRKLEKLRQYLIAENEARNSMGIIDLLRTPRISRFCFALYLLWFLTAFIAFGLAYSTLDLSGNVFINNAIFSASSSASNLFMIWKVDAFHRRSMLMTMYFATSALLFASIAFVESHEYIIPRMILITSVGSCSVASRMASIPAPFIAQLTAATSLKLTFGLFAVMGIIGASITRLIPETKGKEIPDTVEGMIEMYDVNVSKGVVNSS